MAKQRVRASRTTTKDIDRIVDEFLERWDGLPVAASQHEALMTQLESNGKILDSLLMRLTKDLGPKDRARVRGKIELRLNGRDELPGQVRQVFARHRLADLLGDVEWCMMSLAPRELLEVSGPVGIPNDPRRSTVNRWEYADPDDRAAITVLREFAKRHGAWQIFVEQEERAREKHFAHLEKVNELWPGGRPGKALAQPSVRIPFKAAVDRAELPPKLRLHDLRHSFASLFLIDGGDIFKLSKILGHSSVTITERTYAHLKPDAYEADYGRVAFRMPGGGRVLALAAPGVDAR